MPQLEVAARVGDPIEHTHKELGGILGSIAAPIAAILIGAAIVAGVAALVASAPVTLPAAAVGAAVAGEVAVDASVAAAATGAAATGAAAVGGWVGAANMASNVCGLIGAGKSIGELIGSHFTAPNAGEIVTGAATVFTGDGQPKAARMSDLVNCHPQFIAEGSDSVFIEGWNASRKGDATMCAGKIQDGCPTVLIGGASIGRADSKDRSETGPVYDGIFKAIDWGGTALGLAGAKGLGLAAKLAGAGFKGYGETKLWGHEQVAAFGGDFDFVADIVTGAPVKEWNAIEWGAKVVDGTGAGVDSYDAATADPEPRTY